MNYRRVATFTGWLWLVTFVTSIPARLFFYIPGPGRNPGGPTRLARLRRRLTLGVATVSRLPSSEPRTPPVWLPGPDGWGCRPKPDAALEFT